MRSKRNPPPVDRPSGAGLSAKKRISIGHAPARTGAGLHRSKMETTIPIPYRAKKPIIKAWQSLVITQDNLAEYFDGKAQNIGVQFGKASGGLTDIDLDCVEAMTLARYLLPQTPAVFGRASKQRSHFLFYIDDAPNKASSIYRC